MFSFMLWLKSKPFHSYTTTVQLSSFSLPLSYLQTIIIPFSSRKLEKHKMNWTISAPFLVPRKGIIWSGEDKVRLEAAMCGDCVCTAGESEYATKLHFFNAHTPTYQSINLIKLMRWGRIVKQKKLKDWFSAQFLRCVLCWVCCPDRWASGSSKLPLLTTFCLKGSGK